jgi:hypothetical protein
VDHRDPSRPAAASVRRRRPAPSFTVTDEMMERVFKDILPVSQSCVRSALRTLTAAKAMGTISAARAQALRRSAQ